MTIYNGCDGSLNLYYKGLLISSFALTKKKTFDRYEYQGQYLILKSMRENLNIKQIKLTLTYFCDIIYKRKLNKQPIRRSDHEYFISCLFGLLKLKVIDNDEANGYLIMPRRKLSQLKTSKLKN
tara:strand:- start:1465 stop:1836 length:372 start_codon:yes stop_codon:yes gene_type:complete